MITASAYLTYVALDAQSKPMTVPPLILETEDERRRLRQAMARKEMRKRERQERTGA
jgi:acyl-CoA hydrolase